MTEKGEYDTILSKNAERSGGMAIENLRSVWPEWEVARQIGSGSFGVVYEAVRKDLQVESRAAIKVISIPQSQSEVASLRSEGLSEEETRLYLRGMADSFVKEIELMETFKGVQNIVSVEDYKVVEKQTGIGWDIFIRMELLTPFTSYLQGREMTEQEVLKLGCDICAALERCATRDVIHRDIKPENIFVNSFGDFKLGDFGIARRMESFTGGLSQKGTYNYMAPEVEKGGHYDATADIYSLGLVLYRLLNGNRLPFLTQEQVSSPNLRMAAVRRRMDGEPLPPPCNASPAAAQAILCACAYDPRDRFATATAMKNALTALASRNGGFAPPAKPAEPTVRVSDARVSLEEDPPPKTDRSAPPATPDKTISVRRAPGRAAAFAPEMDTFGPVPTSSNGKRKALIAAVILLSAALLFGIVFVLLKSTDRSGEEASSRTGTSSPEASAPSEGSMPGTSLPAEGYQAEFPNLIGDSYNEELVSRLNNGYYGHTFVIDEGAVTYTNDPDYADGQIISTVPEPGQVKKSDEPVFHFTSIVVNRASVELKVTIHGPGSVRVGDVWVDNHDNGTYTESLWIPGAQAFGEGVSFRITPVSGYRLSKLNFDGTPFELAYSFSFHITESTTLEVTFAPEEETTLPVSVHVRTEGGYVTVNGHEVQYESAATAFTLQPGNNMNLSFYPDDGYKLDELTVNGDRVPVTNGTYTLQNVRTATWIEISFTRTSTVPQVTDFDWTPQWDGNIHLDYTENSTLAQSVIAKINFLFDIDGNYVVLETNHVRWYIPCGKSIYVSGGEADLSVSKGGNSDYYEVVNEELYGTDVLFDLYQPRTRVSFPEGTLVELYVGQDYAGTSVELRPIVHSGTESGMGSPLGTGTVRSDGWTTEIPYSDTYCMVLIFPQ